jgi:hypothetical protein
VSFAFSPLGPIVLTGSCCCSSSMDAVLVRPETRTPSNNYSWCYSFLFAGQSTLLLGDVDRCEDGVIEAHTSLTALLYHSNYEYPSRPEYEDRVFKVY